MVKSSLSHLVETFASHFFCRDSFGSLLEFTMIQENESIRDGLLSQSA